MTYRFGPFELDPTGPGLTRDGRPVSLTNQPLRLLLQLVEANGRIVTREAIHGNLWAHPFVEADQGINQCIRKVRAALEDDPSRPFFIETLPRRGYRFICPVVAAGERAIGAAGRRVARWGLVAGTVLVLGAAALLLAPATKRAGPRTVDPAALGQADVALASAAAHLDRRRVPFVERAVNDLGELVASDPGLPGPRLKLAVASSLLYWYSGRDEAARTARSHLRRAEALGGDPAQIWFAKGVLSFHDRDYEAALSAFARAGESDPPAVGPDLDLMLGKTLRRMGRWEEALAVFGRGYEANPTSFEITYAVASTARYMRDHEVARRFLTLAHELDEGHWVPWAIGPVEALREAGDTALAAQRAEESAEELGYGFLFAASQALSRVMSTRIVENVPAYAGPEAYHGQYHLSMGEAFRVQGMRALASAHFDSAAAALGSLASWPESHRGMRISLLASAEAGRGNRRRALELVREAEAMLPLETDAMAGSTMRIQLAQALMVTGDYGAAVELIELLLERPSTLTPGLVRTDPIWAPVREHRRVLAALAKLEHAAGPRRLPMDDAGRL